MVTGSGVGASGRIVELINTRHCPDGDDVLADERAESWLRNWLNESGRPADGPIEPARLAELRTVREGLRQLAAVNNAQPPETDVIHSAAATLRKLQMTMELGDGHGAEPLLAPTSTDAAAQALAAIAEAYLTARSSTDWHRVKACAAPDCRWTYLDNSRNRSRRWCDMTECGNRAKNRAWRQRRAPTA